jgi:hypothetical protein
VSLDREPSPDFFLISNPFEHRNPVAEFFKGSLLGSPLPFEFELAIPFGLTCSLLLLLPLHSGFVLSHFLPVALT